MGRRKDLIWKYVEESKGGFKCMFCQGVFRGGATRIKAHLAKHSGEGIEICARVTEEAHAEACLAWHAKGRKRESTSTPGKKK